MLTAFPRPFIESSRRKQEQVQCHDKQKNKIFVLVFTALLRKTRERESEMRKRRAREENIRDAAAFLAK